MQDRNSGCGGFTLVEMLVTTGIFAIGASIAVGDFVGGAARHKLDAAKSALIQNLRMARSTAVHQNLEVRVTFLNALDQYAIWTDLDRNGVVDAGESEQYMMDPGVDLLCQPEQGTFSPKGTFSSSNPFCLLSMQTSSEYESLHLMPSGHVGDYNEYGVIP